MIRSLALSMDIYIFNQNLTMTSFEELNYFQSPILFASIVNQGMILDSVQVKSFNRSQRKQKIFQFHAKQPMALSYFRHMTENKLFETKFRVPLRKSK